MDLNELATHKRFIDLLNTYKNLEKEYADLKKSKEILEDENLAGSSAHTLIKNEWDRVGKELRKFDNTRFKIIET